MMVAKIRRPLAVALIAVGGSCLLAACATSPEVSWDGSTSGGSNEGNGSNPSEESSLGGRNDANGASDAKSASGCEKVDVIFAIDTSLSMEEEQANLAKNLPRFVEVLNDYRTTTTNGNSSSKPLDYRLAFTPSAPAFGGRFNRTRGAGAPKDCSPGPNRAWLERNDGDVAHVAQFLGCRALVVDAANGSQVGGEDMLETALLAVTDSITNGDNKDENGVSFLRDDALLAIVIVTDEDEGGADAPNKPPTASSRPMSDYPGELDKVKGNSRKRWATSVIAGPTACESPGLGKAVEAVRLKKFVSDIGPKNGVFSSICTDDLSKPLAETLKLLTDACKDFPVPPVK